MNFRWLLTLAIAGACSAVSLVGQAAEPFDSSGSLSLNEAVARSLDQNPSLIAESAELRAAQARADRSGLRPPLVLGGDFENVAGTGVLGGVKSAETTLRVSRVFELGGKRGARQALGVAEVARQRFAGDVARLEIATRTTERFIEVVADQQRLEFARERIDLAKRTRGEVARWVEAARNPESDLHAADIAVVDAELELEHAEHELASARTTLAAAWGASEPDFASVVGQLDELPVIEPVTSLAARLPQTVAQRRAELDAAAINARRQVAVASASPDVNLSLGVRRFEALDDQGLVMSVSVPLGSRPRASLAIAEADAELDAVAARRTAQNTEAYQSLFERYQKLSHARTEYEAVRDRMLPKAEQAFAFTRRGFEAGRFSFIALTQAQRTLFELRERRVEAAARYHTILVEVERLTALFPDTAP